jgi:hypothetical protein
LHVRLICANRLQAQGRDGGCQNQTHFQCFHFSGLARSRLVCQGIGNEEWSAVRDGRSKNKTPARRPAFRITVLAIVNQRSL